MLTYSTDVIQTSLLTLCMCVCVSVQLQGRCTLWYRPWRYRAFPSHGDLFCCHLHIYIPFLPPESLHGSGNDKLFSIGITCHFGIYIHTVCKLVRPRVWSIYPPSSFSCWVAFHTWLDRRLPSTWRSFPQLTWTWGYKFLSTDIGYEPRF